VLQAATREDLVGLTVHVAHPVTRVPMDLLDDLANQVIHILACLLVIVDKDLFCGAWFI